MDIPSYSGKSLGRACCRRNSSPVPSPLLTPTLRQPMLQIISYDRTTIPKTPLLLQYDLQTNPNLSRHIRVNPSIGLSKSTMLELRGEPHYASQLLVAEKEIRAAMERLQRTTAFHTRSSSTSSGEVIANWVERLEDPDPDGDPGRTVMNRSVNEFDVEDDSVQPRAYPDSDEGSNIGGGKSKMPVLTVGCSCVNGCYKNVAFAEELASMQWPGNWAIDVEHRNVTPTAQGNSDWKTHLWYLE
jgi:hypothetical protein